jgi:hypothetical protein
MHKESSMELALKLIFAPCRKFNRPIGDSNKRYVGFRYENLEKNDSYLAGLMAFRAMAQEAAKKNDNKARREKVLPLLESPSVMIQTEDNGFSAGFQLDKEKAGLSNALFMLDELESLAKEHILNSLVNRS